MACSSFPEMKMYPGYVTKLYQHSHVALFWLRSKKKLVISMLAFLVFSKRATESSMFVLLVRKIRRSMPCVCRIFVRKYRLSTSCCLARVPEPSDTIKSTAVGLELLPSHYLLQGFYSQNIKGWNPCGFPKLHASWAMCVFALPLSTSKYLLFCLLPSKYQGRSCMSLPSAVSKLHYLRDMELSSLPWNF